MRIPKYVRIFVLFVYVLLISGAPQIVVALSTTIVETVEGSSFNLSCYADGIPKPNITWQRGTGQPFQNGLERWMVRSVTKRNDVSLEHK